MTLGTTLDLTRWLVTLAALHQSIESIAIAKSGRWSWAIVRDDFAHWPRIARAVLGIAASRPRELHTCAITAAVAGLVLPGLAAISLGCLVFTVLVESLRVRGAVGGASDCMTLHVLVPVWVATMIGGEAATRVCLYYIAIQSTVSYSLAGLSKARHPAWRTGAALSRYISRLAAPRHVRLVASPAVALFGSWAVISMECLFGAALVTPTATAFLLTIAAVFHVANALLLGLHRFVLPWIATYPAIVFVAGA